MEDETGQLICDRPCETFELVLTAAESRLLYVRRDATGLQEGDTDAAAAADDDDHDNLHRILGAARPAR